jgi:proteasome accessory factor C
MSATEDVARMLALVPWLLERPGASVAETAQAFAVTEATLRRDLAHLDFCGLPGLGGGDLFDVSIVGDRVVVQMADELRRPLRPTPSEALRLVLTLDAVGEVLGDELPALRTAVAKVRDALGVPVDAVEVVAPSATAQVTVLRRAVADARRTRLRYRGRGEDAAAEREVDPFALHVLDGAWYLQAHDHASGELRSFRVDRIEDLEVLAQPITQLPPDELPPPRYRPAEGDLTVVLDLAPAARWIVDAVVRDAIEERGDGVVRLTFRTDRPTWVVELVLMAGGAASVVAPSEVASLVRDRARAALERYRSAALGPEPR